MRIVTGAVFVRSGDRSYFGGHFWGGGERAAAKTPTTMGTIGCVLRRSREGVQRRAGIPHRLDRWLAVPNCGRAETKGLFQNGHLDRYTPGSKGKQSAANKVVG